MTRQLLVTGPEAPRVVPWFKEAYQGPGVSTCKGRWVAIRKGNRTVYAQWEDAGPFRTDHWQYVFGNERPKPNLNKGAGLDVSPAVRDYLGLNETDATDWKFVEFSEVPRGPWSTLGENNTFVVNDRKKGAVLPGAPKRNWSSPRSWPFPDTRRRISSLSRASSRRIFRSSSNFILGWGTCLCLSVSLIAMKGAASRFITPLLCSRKANQSAKPISRSCPLTMCSMKTATSSRLARPKRLMRAAKKSA